MAQPLVPALHPHGESIFATMSGLAIAHDAVNLGQGFPDDPPPEPLVAAAGRALARGAHQYPPARGVPALREAIARHQARYGLRLDPDQHVTVTTGATGALAAAVLGLVRPGDEVVLIDPAYDAYSALVDLAGGVRRHVPLRPTGPDLTFELDVDALRGAVSDRTRLILLNTPHNPTGAVLTSAELQAVADVATAHDAFVVTDEVYEHLVLDGEHVPIATLPGMWERTLTISSAGKTFSVTGWKVGWASGPADLVEAVTRTAQWLTFSGGAPLQPAVAEALDDVDTLVTPLRDSLRRRRDLLSAGLAEVGLAPRPAAGTYFVLADVAPLGVTSALEWCRGLPEAKGVAAVPVASFCTDPVAVEATRTLARFAFCKSEDTIREGLRRLAR